MSPELITFLSAMLPVTELRGAIPIAIKALGLSPTSAFLWAVAGNLVPNFIILATLEPCSKFLMKKSKFLNKFFSKLFEKTRTKHSKRFTEYGSLFLIMFVAIPMPGSGSWTGCLIAFLFGVPYFKAIGLISTGIFLAGILVTFGFESILTLIEILT